MCLQINSTPLIEKAGMRVYIGIHPQTACIQGQPNDGQATSPPSEYRCVFLNASSIYFTNIHSDM